MKKRRSHAAAPFPSLRAVQIENQSLNTRKWVLFGAINARLLHQAFDASAIVLHYLLPCNH